MSKLLLPKGYLSWSAYSLWKSSKKAYRKRYYEDGASPDSPEMRFGQYISRMLENDPENDLVKHVPRYAIPEHMIDVRVQNVRIKGQLDTFDPKRLRLGEYKTGVKPWTNLRVKKHGQLAWYCMMIKAKYGSYDPEVQLHWIPTELVKEEKDERGLTWEVHGKRLRLTGEVRSFTRFIEPYEIENIEREMLKTAYEINLDYRNYLSTLDI